MPGVSGGDDSDIVTVKHEVNQMENGEAEKPDGKPRRRRGCSPEELRDKAKALQERARQKERKQKTKEKRMKRSEETARKVIAGVCYLDTLKYLEKRATDAPTPEERETSGTRLRFLRKRDDAFLKRDRDRALMGYPPRMALSPQERGLPKSQWPSDDPAGEQIRREDDPRRRPLLRPLVGPADVRSEAVPAPSPGAPGSRLPDPSAALPENPSSGRVVSG
jgi:hypothetical protein